MSRTIFFISDGTGVTAETMGRSLLTQFDIKDSEFVSIPYIDTAKKAHELIIKINESQQKNKLRSIVFMTIAASEISTIIKSSEALVIDFFQTFVSSLEKEFGTKASQIAGKFHNIDSYKNYKSRIDAINYVLSCDDGLNTQNYEHADVILIGISRSGKTPTCLYLALQFGIFAANYPLTEEELGTTMLPKALLAHKHKIFGLTINPERLQQIRQERLPDSRYSSLEQCKIEHELSNIIFTKNNIPYLDSTLKSIEELAASIFTCTGIKSKLR